MGNEASPRWGISPSEEADVISVARARRRRFPPVFTQVFTAHVTTAHSTSAVRGTRRVARRPHTSND